MDDQAPVRITFDRGSAAAVNRRFIGGFFAFAMLFAGAAFYRPAIQAFAVGFPIYLVWWKLRLRRASRPGWALVVSGDRLVLEAGEGRSRAVNRQEADAVRFIGRKTYRGGGSELLVLNRLNEPLFSLEIDDSDRFVTEQALIENGWPVG